MTKKDLDRDFKILKSQKFVENYRIEGDKRYTEYYKVYFTDYHRNDHEIIVNFTDKGEDLRQYIREFIEKRNHEKALQEIGDTYSIILEDHESGDLFIAEVRTNGDIERLEKENKKLNEEQRDDNRDRDDYYGELSYRTGLKIYKADVLYI